jgi:glycosyltransferase involved in cell wall biosynthesis
MISVIMPMRNAAPYVKASVLSVLNGADDLELIVIDDKSTDNSRKIVGAMDDKRIRLIDGPGMGISEALNTGFKAARGSILMRCDADDIYPTDRIQWQRQWLKDNPEYGSVCGSFSAINRRGRLIINFACGSAPSDITDDLRSGKVRTHLCTFAIRSEIASEIGDFRRFFQTGEDVDYQLRLGELCKVMYLPVDCYSYRIHSASITHSISTTAREFYEGMARTFQVERQKWGRDSLQTGKIPAGIRPAI